MAESKDPNAGPNDWLGLVTFSGGLFLLIFALVRGNAEGWGSTLIVSFLVGAVVLLVAFVVVEARIRYPMFDLTLFRKPTFGGACIAAFALSASMFSMFLYLTLYLQNGLGLSPLEAGVRFLPLSLLSFLVAPIAGRLSARVPIRALIGGGMALVAIALMLMRGLSASSEWTALLGGFIVAGIGVALVNAPLASTAVSVVPPERAGMGSGINSTFRQVGIATGTAALGALFQHILVSDATGRSRACPPRSSRRAARRVPGPAAHEALPRALHRRAERHPARGRDRRLRRRRALRSPSSAATSSRSSGRRRRRRRREAAPERAGMGSGINSTLPPGRERHRHGGPRRPLPAHPGHTRARLRACRRGPGQRAVPVRGPRLSALHRRAQRHPARRASWPSRRVLSFVLIRGSDFALEAPAPRPSPS